MDIPLTAAPKTERSRSAPTPLFVLLAALAVIVIGVLGWRLWAAFGPVHLPGTPATAEAVEAQYGIRITHIAVLADGGLIDFRFQVIDVDKAAPLFSLDKRPIMIVEKTGQVVDSLYHPPMGHGVKAGQSQYFIYNDNRGVIKAGMSISVLLGDLRLEHIIAQ
jgi:hypothetical protein